MNCQDAERLILASGDSAPTDEELTVLEAHIAGCASCARLREAVLGAGNRLRETAAAVSVPDARHEWREIRSRIQVPERAAPSWARLLPAIGLPIAAAAAIAIAFVLLPERPATTDVAESGSATATSIAEGTQLTEFAWEPHAEYVEIPGSDDSMVVYLDEPSGWLVVWAVEPNGHTGG